VGRWALTKAGLRAILFYNIVFAAEVAIRSIFGLAARNIRCVACSTQLSADWAVHAWWLLASFHPSSSNFTHVLNSTKVRATQHFPIAIYSPAMVSPGVLQNPVLLAFLLPITYDYNCMTAFLASGRLAVNFITEVHEVAMNLQRSADRKAVRYPRDHLRLTEYSHNSAPIPILFSFACALTAPRKRLASIFFLLEVVLCIAAPTLVEVVLLPCETPLIGGLVKSCHVAAIAAVLRVLALRLAADDLLD